MKTDLSDLSRHIGDYPAPAPDDRAAIATAAPAVFAAIHHRTPVILEQADLGTWLESD